MYIYYFKYYLNISSQEQFLQTIGFNNFISGLNNILNSMGFGNFEWPSDAPSSCNSLFNAGGIIFMILGIGLSKPLADKFGKRNIFGLFLVLSAIALILFYFLNPEGVGIAIALQIIHGFLYGVTIPLLWAMIADVADYSEWKNNRRATAIIFSAMIFGLKVGLSVGGGLGAFLLSKYGYIAEVVNQSKEAVAGIKMSVSIYPGLIFILGAALLFKYEIDKSMENKIESDLKQRRN
ncbi:MAG: hypothetical protein RLZZ546_3185, partial [Bacteroidota bacterium]